MRLIQKEDPEEQAALDAFKSVYKKLKPLNWIVLAIYILIPIFEKPSWCVLNPEIDTSTTQGYWYCNDADGMITNSGIPKLPPQITESIDKDLAFSHTNVDRKQVFATNDGKALISKKANLNKHKSVASSFAKPKIDNKASFAVMNSYSTASLP